MNRLISAVFALLVLGTLASSTLYVVDQRQYAIVFALGEIKEVVNEPGLHFKLPPPFQNVTYFEKRIMTIDTPDSDRFITSEKKNLVVDSFVKWRISDPKLYYVSVQGRETDAVYRIQQSLKDALNNALVGHVGKFLALRYPRVPQARRVVSAMVSVSSVHALMHLASQVPVELRDPVIAEAKAMLVRHYTEYDSER